MRKNIVTMCLITMAGCSFMARGEDQYRQDTRAELEKHNAEIKSCYDNALAQDPNMSGTVVVNFSVEKKTGKFTQVSADPSQSTAPETLQNCVVNTIDGLVLMPEDRREGQATFSYVFNAQGMPMEAPGDVPFGDEAAPQEGEAPAEAEEPPAEEPPQPG
jgi:hypothetical protein